MLCKGKYWSRYANHAAAYIKTSFFLVKAFLCVELASIICMTLRLSLVSSTHPILSMMLWESPLPTPPIFLELKDKFQHLKFNYDVSNGVQLGSWLNTDGRGRSYGTFWTYDVKVKRSLPVEIKREHKSCSCSYHGLKIFLYYSKCKRSFVNVVRCLSRAISNHTHASLSFADNNRFLHRLFLPLPEQSNELQSLPFCWKNFVTLKCNNMANTEFSAVCFLFYARSILPFMLLWPLVVLAVMSALFPFLRLVYTHADVSEMHDCQDLWNFTHFSPLYIAVVYCTCLFWYFRLEPLGSYN